MAKWWVETVLCALDDLEAAEVTRLSGLDSSVFADLHQAKIDAYCAVRDAIEQAAAAHPEDARRLAIGEALERLVSAGVCPVVENMTGQWSLWVDGKHARRNLYGPDLLPLLTRALATLPEGEAEAGGEAEPDMAWIQAARDSTISVSAAPAGNVLRIDYHPCPQCRCLTMGEDTQALCPACRKASEPAPEPDMGWVQDTRDSMIAVSADLVPAPEPGPQWTAETKCSHCKGPLPRQPKRVAEVLPGRSSPDWLFCSQDCADAAFAEPSQPVRYRCNCNRCGNAFWSTEPNLQGGLCETCAGSTAPAPMKLRLDARKLGVDFPIVGRCAVCDGMGTGEWAAAWLCSKCASTAHPAPISPSEPRSAPAAAPTGECATSPAEPQQGACEGQGGALEPYGDWQRTVDARLDLVQEGFEVQVDTLRGILSHVKEQTAWAWVVGLLAIKPEGFAGRSIKADISTAFAEAEAIRAARGGAGGDRTGTD